MIQVCSDEGALFQRGDDKEIYIENTLTKFKNRILQNRSVDLNQTYHNPQVEGIQFDQPLFQEDRYIITTF